ncbi:hypothetical protein [Nostoc sp. PCC 7524]|uniref:hypothetical protein n=1 Tax=Nostoc sp. (strain ATCC 29411 / PCC 7524) TaxID=28072 RepID=UPI000AA19B75|nr:hypothetical protein [Nostoc sp. PCC 7524]
MKNSKKNINNQESRLSQLSPESKLLPAELAIIAAGTEVKPPTTVIIRSRL